jgi:transposase-like protein
MPKTRPPYPPEFRRQMVELVHAGRDPAELAREFEPTAQSISHWVAQERAVWPRQFHGLRFPAAMGRGFPKTAPPR